MKIIKVSEQICECSFCHTQFSLEKEDYLTKVYYGTIGYTYSFLPGLIKKIKGHYVYCPHCGNVVEI